jgi:hypothetical protein
VLQTQANEEDCIAGTLPLSRRVRRDIVGLRTVVSTPVSRRTGCLSPAHAVLRGRWREIYRRSHANPAAVGLTGRFELNGDMSGTDLALTIRLIG